MFNKKRLRNYGMWFGLASKLILLAQLVAILCGYPLPQEKVEIITIIVIDIVLGGLASLGIISNPTKPNSKGFNL